MNNTDEAFCKGSLSVSQKRGTITLIPKGDENLTELKNWRPISLLNIDYKILSKVLARRMENILPKLVHSDQTGFVNGRYVGQNIRLLNDIMVYTDIKKLPGIFLFVDFEKAFDTIAYPRSVQIWLQLPKMVICDLQYYTKRCYEWWPYDRLF